MTLDADLQNDPKDLPKFLEGFQHYDCVCGSRVRARGAGDSWVRVASSRIANWVRNKLSGEEIADAGWRVSGLQTGVHREFEVFQGDAPGFADAVQDRRAYGDGNRGDANAPRFAGRSHYGVWNRLFASFYDLLAVRWMKRRMFRFEVAERTRGTDYGKDGEWRMKNYIRSRTGKEEEEAKRANGRRW